MRRLMMTVLILVAVSACNPAPTMPATGRTAIEPVPAYIKTTAKSKHTPAASPAPKLVSPKAEQKALPWWGDQNFPIIHTSKQMDVLQMMAFGLHPGVLMEEREFLNWYENQGGFHLDILPIGTLILLDRFGNVVYKLDCSNRLVNPTPGYYSRPVTSMVLPTTGPVTYLPTSTPYRVSNWFSRLFGRLAASFE